MYIQPTSSDFNPGSITWKLQNNTGSILTEVDLAYTVYIYNNEGRANNWNCSYSYDNTTFVNIPSLDLVSVEADEDLLYTYNQSTSIPGLSIGDGDFSTSDGMVQMLVVPDQEMNLVWMISA